MTDFSDITGFGGGAGDKFGLKGLLHGTFEHRCSGPFLTSRNTQARVEAGQVLIDIDGSGPDRVPDIERQPARRRRFSVHLMPEDGGHRPSLLSRRLEAGNLGRHQVGPRAGHIEAVELLYRARHEIELITPAYPFIVAAHFLHWGGQNFYVCLVPCPEIDLRHLIYIRTATFHRDLITPGCNVPI
jgi:hypothetical protein